MFVINTDMGYLSGELHKSVRFQYDKKDARQFTAEQIKAFGEGITADLHKYYCTEWCLVVEV